jgi:phosphogluconate dehydratase
MSGASGRVPAAIHVTPEAAAGGPLARVREGDMIRLDCTNGRLDVLIDATDFATRAPVAGGQAAHQAGTGRELFSLFRANAMNADLGAGVL